MIFFRFFRRRCLGRYGRGRGCRVIGREIRADITVALLVGDVQHTLIAGRKALFGVGQRRSRQPQLVGKVHLTAKAHLYAVLIGKLNITQVAYVQRGRAVKQSV